MNIATLISGGVDSSVVVHLLCEQGYKPDLFYIKIGMDRDTDLSCSAEEDIEIWDVVSEFCSTSRSCFSLFNAIVVRV